MSSVLGRLYRGETAYDFIGNRRKWYVLSGALLLISLFALTVIRLNLGIDFSGGTSFQLANGSNIDVERAIEVAREAGDLDEDPIAQRVGDDGLRVRTEKIAEFLPNADPQPTATPTTTASPAVTRSPLATASPRPTATAPRTVSAQPTATVAPSRSPAPADAPQAAACAPQDRICAISDALAKEFGAQRSDVSAQSVGANWGRQISTKALQGLVAFLILVTLYISLRFEWKMALATLAAMVHDLIITAGIYGLVGFEVTPSTVIALLTILGYSMYDTIVVFDRVREDTAGIEGGSRLTYSAATNNAINETVMRSINTSLTSLIPVGALLFVGAFLLGAGTLKDLALALFIGLMASTYSSIFVAAPLLVELKEREPEMQALAKRVQTRGVRSGGAAPALAGAGGPTVRIARAGEDADEPEPARPQRASTARPQPRPARKKGKGGRPGRPSGKKRR